MDDKLRAGYPTSMMLIFSAVWFGVVGYAAFMGVPVAGANHSNAIVTDVSSISREADPETTGTIQVPSYWDQHNRAHLE